MGMISEFKEFAVKGNVIDMAVGVIIGGAFGKIVASLVNDIIMPPIGLLLGGVDFKALYLNLGKESYESLEAATAAGAPVVRYGLFINNILDFLIVAFTIFMVIRTFTKAKKKAA